MFKLIKIENARMNVPSPLFLPIKSSEAVTEGEALVYYSNSGTLDGTLTKCGATTKPEFIAMKSLASGASDRVIPVFKVQSNQIFEVETSATPSSLVAGNKVTLHTDGLQVTATLTSGVAEIVDTNGATTAGDTVIVRF